MNFPDQWPFPQRQEFAGQFVTLRPRDATRDAVALFEITHRQPEFSALWRYLPYGPFASFAQFEALLIEQENDAQQVFFTVFSHELQAPVGSLALISIARANGCAEIGHVWYSPVAQRSKVNTESVYLLLRHLFDDLKYRRVEWKCNNLNEASKRAAQRMGFQYEGLFRQHQVIKNESRDTAWFAMLDGEWPQRRANFERWLYEENSPSLTELNAP